MVTHVIRIYACAYYIWFNSNVNCQAINEFTNIYLNVCSKSFTLSLLKNPVQTIWVTWPISREFDFVNFPHGNKVDILSSLLNINNNKTICCKKNINNTAKLN